MELRQLKNFYTVSKLMNITSASKKLNISQPALSISIKKLEEELGVKLFSRDGHFISLTDAGKKLVPLALQMLHCEQDIIDMCNNTDDGKKEISICTDYSQPFIADIVSRFHHEFPDCSIRFTSENSPEKPADILISGSSDLPEKSGIGEEVVFMEKILVAVPRIIRPVYESPVTLDYLLDNDLIGLNEKYSLGKVEREFLSKHGIHLNHSITCDNSSVMSNLLMNGAGLAFVPEKTWLLKNNPAIHLIRFEIPGFSVFTKISVSSKFNERDYLKQFFSFLLNGLKELDVQLL